MIYTLRDMGEIWGEYGSNMGESGDECRVSRDERETRERREIEGREKGEKQKKSSELYKYQFQFIDDGKNIVNGIVTYGQKNDSLEGMLKGYSIYGIYARNFDTFLPHVILGWNQFLNQGKKNDEEWYCYVGSSIPLFNNFSAELGIDYDRQASAFKTWGGYTSVSYLFNNFLTTELYTQYVLASSVKYDSNNYKIDNSYTIGLRITTTF